MSWMLANLLVPGRAGQESANFGLILFKGKIPKTNEKFKDSFQALKWKIIQSFAFFGIVSRSVKELDLYKIQLQFKQLTKLRATS